MAAVVLALLIAAAVLFVIELARSKSLLAAGLLCWVVAVAVPQIAAAA